VRVRRFLHVVLFGVAVLLMWQITAAWRRPLEGRRPAAQQPLAEEKPLPAFPSLSPQMGKRYAEVIADKDLFTPSRSRTIVEAKPAETVPPPSHLKLVGVLLASGREEAFFSDATQGGKVVRVRKGEALGSYKLVNVAPLQATLTLGQDGDEVSLPLFVLDSNTAAQGQRLMPPVMRANQGRPGQPQTRQGQPFVPAQGFPEAANQSATEAHAIRQNIQQLQQRLRQLRRQAARNGDGNDENEDPDEAAEEEEEE
jgi:hypothetical protein